MTEAFTTDVATAEEITEAAGIAAAKGEWDLVDSYYRQRAALLPQTTLSPTALAHVLAVDRVIEAQIKVAQAGLDSLLDDAARMRQRIHGLRRWNGALSSDSGTIERHV